MIDGVVKMVKMVKMVEMVRMVRMLLETAGWDGGR